MAEAEDIPKFAADRMLKRLARWLRLMGADVVCDESRSGAETLTLARAQGRPLLTRDKRLRTALARVPLDGFEVLDLPVFLQRLR